MPLYEYQCTQCGERVELIQRLSDPAPACAKCSGDMKKLVSAPAIQFKGSGWYKTDYASSKPSASSSESKSETKSESAPSTTTAPKSETKSGD